MWSFSDFQYGFRSSRWTADLLTVVSDRISRAFKRSGATQAVAFDISKAFDRVCHAGLLHKLECYGISDQIFGLIYFFSVTDSFPWFLVESLHKKIQLMLEFLKAPFLVLHFSYYTLMTLLTMSSFILLSRLMIHFSYYTLMTILTMLPFILLSMLMILLSILSVIRHLICGSN